MPAVPSEKEKRKRRIGRETGRAPAAVVFLGGQRGREDSPCPEGPGPEGSRRMCTGKPEEWMGEPRPAGEGGREITGRCPRRHGGGGKDALCPQGARERTLRALPLERREGEEGASSPEGGGGTGNPVRKGTRAPLPGRDSRPRRVAPGRSRGGWEGDRAGGTPRSAVWDRREREAAGPSTGQSRAEGSAAGSPGMWACLRGAGRRGR